MKITSVKAVYPKWRGIPKGPWQYHFWQILVRVETDTGHTGYGYGGGGLPGVEIVNSHIRELVDGARLDTVEDIKAIWDKMYFGTLPYGRGGIPMMALSGVDLALWDALGVARGKPVYDLLGGARKNKVRAYANTENYPQARDLGYNAIKFKCGKTRSDRDYDITLKAAKEAHAAIGPSGTLMTDCYLSWDAANEKLANPLIGSVCVNRPISGS